MRKIIVTLALALAMTGCSGHVNIKQEPTPDPYDPNEVYLKVIRKEYPVLKTVPDQELIDLAVNTCETLEYGSTGEDLMRVAIDSGMDVGMAGFVMGAGVENYCPELYDQLIDNGSPT